MGFWSYLFPGDEGVLADLFWSNQQTSSGITLKNQTYEGTTGDDTASFAQLSLSYNPYQSEVYLLEGNDSARTVGTSSGTKFYLGDGDDFFTALDGLRYSRVEGGRGDDTIRIKESLWNREGLYHSIITTDAGNDYVLIEKEDGLKDSRSGIFGGGIFTGDGDDTLIIKGNGLLVQSSGTSLTYADGSTTRDGIINLGEGNDFLGIYKWNAPLPTGSESAGSSPYLLNSDIDLGGGDDVVDLRSLDFFSSTGVLVKGGDGHDVAILPLDISSPPAWLQEFESFVYAPNSGNGTPASITGNGAFKEGVTLSAPVVTGDPDGDALNPNYSYQWFKGSTAISGAIASTYVVPVTGAGTYKVAVTYTDAQGFTATLDSPEQVVSTFNNGNGTSASITGNGAFKEGVTLSAPVVTGDLDGDAANPNYSYQWFKGSTAITNATASTYAVPALGGGTYKVGITYTDAQGFTATVDSPGQVVSTFNNGNGTPGAITGSGAFREGVTLTAPVVTGDPDGMPTNPNYKYQWYKGGNIVTGATASTYAVPASGAGTYKVAVTYTDAQDFTATVNSANQAVAKFNNGNGTPGAITGSGAFREGVTLTAPVVTGDPDGMPTNPNYKYQWYKNNSAISSATGKTYKVPTTGSGTYRVAVTYRDAQDFTATVNSANQFIAKVLTGKASANTLVGTVGDDLITGLGGADRKKGGAGRDTFQYRALSDSRLSTYDRITDFTIGTDIFDAPRAVSSKNIKQLGRVSALTQAGIEKVLGKSNSSLGKQVFASHRAATFTVGTGRSVRTFLGVNDATAGFIANTDALIEITGFKGNLNNLGII
jgi:hypothetical protein